MNFKIALTTFTLFCLVQGNDSETIAEVIANLTSIVNSIKFNIDTVIQDGGKLIGQTHGTINRVISQAEVSIQKQLNQLVNIENEAKVEAEQKHVDITKCVNDVHDALLLVDLNGLKLCGRTEDLDLLGVDLGKLGALKGSLSISVSTCLLKNPMIVDLKRCVLTEVDSSQSQIDNLYDRINTVCGDAKNNADACVEVNLRKLDGSIDGISHDLKTCLLNIL